MSKIGKNILYNLAYQILVLITPLITTPYISRVLGVEGIGTYSYVSSVEYYFFIFITLGLTNYGNRSIAKCRDDRNHRSRTFWSIYFMQVFCGILAIAAYAIYIARFSDIAYRQFFAVYLLHLASAAVDINWFFFGLEEFKFTTVRNAIVKVATLICILAFVRGQNALLVYFIIVAGSSLVSNLLLWTRVFRHVDFLMPTFKECAAHIKPNLLLFIPIIAMSVYRVMDKIMIKQLSGIEQNGYYENADRIITISLTAFSAIATVMMPAVSNMVAQKKDDAVKKILREMMQIVNWLSVAMVFGLMVISRRFAPLFFGSQFLESGVLMIGLAPTIFFSGWKNVLRSQYLIPYEKDSAYVVSLIVGALCNVIANLYFIPQLGARGAVIGTLIAELAGFLIQTSVAGQVVNVFELVKDFVWFLPAGGIMAFIAIAMLKLVPDSLIGIAIVVILSAVIYAVFSTVTLWIVYRAKAEKILATIKGRLGRK